MRSLIVRPAARRAAAAAFASVLIVGPAHAQRDAVAARAVVDIVPYAGYIRFGNYLDGPLGADVRSAAAPVGGAQLSVRLSPAVALVGNVGYSRGDLEVGLPIVGGLDVGSTQSWLYDAGLELRLPSAGRGPQASPLTPFLQVGAGAITTRLGSLGVRTTSTNFAGNAGLGLDLALGRTLGMRLMVKDYVGRYRSESVAGASLRGDVSHNIAGSFGFRLSF